MIYSKNDLECLADIIHGMDDLLFEIIYEWKTDRKNTETYLNIKDFKTDFKINEFERYAIITEWFMNYFYNLKIIPEKNSYFVPDDLDYQIKNVFESSVNGQIYFPDSFCNKEENKEAVKYWSFSEDELDFMKYILDLHHKDNN